MKTILTLLLTLLPVVALAQPVDPFQHQDAYTAPGRVIFTGSITCSPTSTNFLMFDQGATGADAHFLVPDSSRVVVTSVATGTTTALCGLFDTPYAKIGDEAGTDDAAKEFDVRDFTDAPNGALVQGGLLLIPASSTRVWRSSYLLSLGLGGARSGLCAAPVLGSATDSQSYTPATDRVRMDGIDVYASCKCTYGAAVSADGECAAAECSNVAGTPSGTLCLVTEAARSKEKNASRMSGATQTLRGQHLGCRCSGATTLPVEVVR